ncbi:protein ABHD11 isoform X2 [Mustela nigripes]|uniref:protein ABHD11 isoform X2 n=1 Tax=Mustela nigripes TaxID=77151 RepID=UPI0028153DBC|nr:protein ABHD11 isoform X2 [Mustela nigripes]
MLRWTRSWRLPLRGLGPCSLSFCRVPVAPSSSARSGAEPRSVRLSYKLLDGEAARPALVFLHGLFGSKTNFSSIAKALAQQTGRRVLTVDARNHGDSPHSPDVSYEAMSQDLQNLLPQLGLVPCVLIGHSMGAGAGRTPDCCGHQPSADHTELQLPVLHGRHEGCRHPGWGAPLLCPKAGRRAAQHCYPRLGRASVPAHQPSGGRWTFCVEGELGSTGPAFGQDHGFPTTTRILPWANPLPPGWKLKICAPQPPR